MHAQPADSQPEELVRLHATLVCPRPQLPYQILVRDELSSVIEDAVDEISNSCDGGKLPRDECKRKLGL